MAWSAAPDSAVISQLAALQPLLCTTTNSFKDICSILTCSPHCPKIVGALKVALDRFDTSSTEGPFSKLALPQMLDACVRYEEIFKGTTVPLMDRSPQTCTLTKRQCFAIQSAAFFCAFSRNSARSLYDPPHLPSINYDEMFMIDMDDSGYREGRSRVEVEKIIMVLDYFIETSKRVAANDPRLDDPNDAIIFLRAGGSEVPVKIRERINSTMPLLPAKVHPLRHSIDDQKQAIRIDFANAVIGGASISFGCVQEEIMFTICPEMNCARLMNTPLEPDEALVMLRCEQFSTLKPGTYAFTMAHGGKHSDAHARSSVVSAIDALDFRGGGARSQYQRSGIDRELVKSMAGFDVRPFLQRELKLPDESLPPPELATGNWGCGAFLGDVQLKSMLQWLTASMCGLQMHYFPFDNKDAHQNLQTVIDAARGAEMTVAELYAVLCEGAGRQGAYNAVMAAAKEKKAVAAEAKAPPPDRTIHWPDKKEGPPTDGQ